MTRARPALILSALAAAVVATAGLALDRIFPPNLARYHERSTEIVDANGRLLRAFTTSDGMWRLKTTADDVDPTYLALLKSYEDSRFALHPGVDPLSVVRATGQLIAHGRIVSGASTITMQAARLLEPRPRTFVNKVIEAARAVQLEWRYSKREVMAIYLTL
ncbi:MAG TPA: transglycosylase domain-containing protein, partial [Reyranella sp.]|nr:transglycosylase domain-containing protein [Reyranella sp.]